MCSFDGVMRPLVENKMQIGNIETRKVNTVQDGLGNQISVLSGLVLLGFVALAFASLATWSVLDPSLSHANNNEVGNMIGFPSRCTMAALCRRTPL